MMEYYTIHDENGTRYRIMARSLADARHQVIDIGLDELHYKGRRNIKLTLMNRNGSEIGKLTVAQASLFYWQSKRTKGKVTVYYSGELAR